MACASMLVRPKVSATSEGITATGCEEGARHVVAVTKQAHFVLKAMTRDETDQLLPVRGLAQSIAREDDDGPAERALAIEPCRGLDSLTVALKSREPRRLEHDLGLGRNAPAFAELRYRTRRHHQRIEGCAVDAAMDHPDAVARHVVPGGNQASGEARIGDDTIAATQLL
jgi:hypothetical protein